ncbi:alpha/beta fold hydrolase [Streptomyces sp. NPDC088387]|uniref:alpha/beta fold hydrolase n=1 Tax=Streptomyces sp. NPDC088387 TaxID=3365859 RepID=UPI0038160B18
MTAPATGRLSAGTHTVEIDGVEQRYHVHGTGPVCVAHSGGPGIDWEYLRMPALEEFLTVVYLEPVGSGGSGRLASHPNGYTRSTYSRFLDGLIGHLGVPKVYVLGHSHGGFVAQYHALRHPGRLAGVILYESAPLTGPEHGAEVGRQVGLFAERNAGRPELPAILAGFGAVADATDDARFTALLRTLVPVYFADYWGREEEFAPFRARVSGSYVTSLDEDLVADVVDDTGTLGSLTVPALVVVGRHDFICGVRWGEELHRLIPGAELAVLENSGHFGHIEEPAEFAAAVAGFVNATAPGAV